ncbi:MAG: hypothetical protein CFE27_08745 [Alphaproteobacteria bacterium PA1]|nr:MAG: hypothetical protein CFE27_08745 [Alphaproteobacteria bacterium PA1]
MHTNSDTPHETIEQELHRIEEDCSHSGKAHFNAGVRWSQYHYFLGIPAVVLSSIAGIAFFKDYPLIGGAISSLVTVLTALSTFLKPAERAASHKTSGDQYLGLKNDARVFRSVRLAYVCDDQAAIDGLDEFTKRRNEMNQASLVFSNIDFNKARKGIDAGESTHKVDKLS